MEKTKVITLSKPIESNGGKEVYTEIHLREPCLIEVEQFYEAQAKNPNSSLPAMRLLIALVSAVPETVLKKMAISDFNQCREYLLVFLSGNLDSNSGSD
ncbi:phage tail assembly protein [Xenorhabdus budapestensis]|uniref:Phage tail assembly protein n=1 Tax=Xenorhabdus budapestensis TaxID=290110 RepID=A0ABX7VJQ3_XENBU|nr:phage tail assembly protein [Xenorhabdus budapestensis]QTL41021.1 phage tail assembly protein [Xenorhabdus budapestensis]